jgi:hypothetical protein
MSAFAYRKLRAPEADGAALIDPPLAEVPALIAANRAAAADRDSKLGMPAGFCAAARRLILPGGNAREAVAQEGEVPRVIMTGHQPTLFHPGVWFKNFLLSSIGAATESVAVNLVVDTDTVRTPGIRVPTGQRDAARIVEVLYDAPGEEVPWELRHQIERHAFETFPQRVHEALAAQAGSCVQSTPLILDQLWPYALHERRQQIADAERVFREATGESIDATVTPLTEGQVRPGYCMAAARQQLERQFGLELLDLHLGSLGFLHHFYFFAESLLARHEEFRQIHNSAAQEYRALNRIRSHAHPVPDLSRDGDWVEVPLWMSSISNPRRRRVFARARGKETEITDREGLQVRLAGESKNDHSRLFLAAELEDIRLRPRALITTMYARLVLSDLFIHGIGGAKYDELADEIIRRFFGIEPPKYVTATATFRLPIERPQVTIDDVRNAARQVRDVRCRPETLVGHPLVASDAGLERELQALASEKRDYLRSHTLRRASHEVFAGLDRINASLVERLQPLARHLQSEQARVVEQFKQSRMLGSREFSFVLFPEDYLVPRLLALAAAEK